MEKVNYFDLIEIDKQIRNPFSREISIFKIKENFGNGFTIFYNLGNGIAVSVRNFNLKKDCMLIVESKTPGASVIFNLNSDINFIYKDKKKHILKKNHVFVELSSDEFYCEVPIKKNTHYTTCSIAIKKELFLELAYTIKNIQEYNNKAMKESYYVLNDSKIDVLQSELVSDLDVKKNFEDTLKNIYLESRTTKLLHYTISKMANYLNASINIHSNKYRISSLERAKEIIMKEYSSKLSIKTIAYKSAINECYLKKDFKEYFGMTILEMLQKRRLTIAKQLLNQNYSVKEVTLKIGYKDSNHFSKLFVNSFKISPSAFRKQANHLDYSL